MITIEEFMRNVGIKDRRTVLKWINSDLIPGIQKDCDTQAILIPDSARRPFLPRVKPTSDVYSIYSSMVQGCIKRQHICHRTYPFLSEGEFDRMVGNLIDAGLIFSRVDNGILNRYYRQHRLRSFTTAACNLFGSIYLLALLRAFLVAPNASENLEQL